MKKLIRIIAVAAIFAACTKVNYSQVYPNGTKFNYAAGPLTDLLQSGKVPTNPFVIDSLAPGTYGRWIGYYVTSANGLHYTMSDADIKPVKK